MMIAPPQARQPVQPFEIKPQDVLLGKGGPNAVHVGTIAFKAIIESRMESYMNAKYVMVNGKNLVTMQVVNSIYLAEGRFLSRGDTPEDVSSNQDWCIMSDNAARVKVREFFREFVKNVRKKKRPCVLLDRLGLSGLFGAHSSFSEIVLHVATSPSIRNFVSTRLSLMEKRHLKSGNTSSLSGEKSSLRSNSRSPDVGEDHQESSNRKLSTTEKAVQLHASAIPRLAPPAGAGEDHQESTTRKLSAGGYAGQLPASAILGSLPPARHHLSHPNSTVPGYHQHTLFGSALAAAAAGGASSFLRPLGGHDYRLHENPHSTSLVASLFERQQDLNRHRWPNLGDRVSRQDAVFLEQQRALLIAVDGVDRKEHTASATTLLLSSTENKKGEASHSSSANDISRATTEEALNRLLERGLFGEDEDDLLSSVLAPDEFDDKEPYPLPRR